MNLSPLPVLRFYSNIGLPLVGGKLFTYAAGTTTKIATYQNQTGTLNTNPVILNFRGEANVWLDPALTYKFVLAGPFDTDPPGNPIWSVDKIAGALTILDITQQFLGPIIYPRTAAEITASITPTAFIYPPGDVRRYGADPTGTNDSASAFAQALAACSPVALTPQQPAFAQGGTFRVDTTVVIEDYRELQLFGNAKLIRKSSGSANTTPVVQVKGNYAVLRGGQLWSENNSPSGVLNCGHRDTSSTENALFWRVHDTQVFGKDWLGTQASFNITGATQANPCVVSIPGHNFTNGQVIFIENVAGMTQLNHRVYTVAGAVAGVSVQLSGVNSTAYGAYTSGGRALLAPGVGDIIGIYVPSSQPFLGNTANYFGTVSNCKIHSCTQAVAMTDLANGHTFENVSWEGIWYLGFHLNGAYGNRFSGGFLGTAYADGFINIYLEPKAYPGAPFASTLESVRNHFYGFTIENATDNNFGLYVSAASCSNNYVEFAFNSTGTAITDPAGNTVIELGSTLQANGVVRCFQTVAAGGLADGVFRLDRANGLTGLARIEWVTTGDVLKVSNLNGGTTDFYINTGQAARFDGSTTAGQTRFLVYDVDNATLERVTVGAADSGGAGFKVLRIPN